MERRARREQARVLACQHPQIARDLRIGRPDLPHDFDDGGLVDINSAPEQVLAGLPGIGPHYARLIVAIRDERGPYADPDDLIHRGAPPATVVHASHETLIAVPVVGDL